MRKDNGFQESTMPQLYKAPTFETVQAATQSLDTEYKGTDEKRLASIKLIQDVNELCPTVDSQNIMLDMLIESLEEIGSTYRIASSQKKAFGIFASGGFTDSLLKKTLGEKAVASITTGSDFDAILRKALGLSDQNNIDKYHRLIYCAAMHAFLKTHPVSEALQQRNKTRLATAVAACKSEIHELEKKRFSATVVKQKFSEISEKYAKLKKENCLRLFSAKPKTEDHPKLSANELCLYLENGKLHYVVIDAKGKIHEGEITAGEEKDHLKKVDVEFLQKLFQQNPLPTKLLYTNDAKLTAEGREAIKALFDLTAKRKHITKDNTAVREAMLAFIRTVDKKLQSSNEAVTNYSFNNTIRHAVIIHVMEELEAEYTWHSDLYNLCQEVINLSHTKKLSILDKYNYYSALHAFIPKISRHTEEPSNWLTAPIPNANQFLSDITGKLLRKMSQAYEDLENGHLSPTLDSIRTLINMAVGFGIGIAIGVFAGGLVTLSAEQKVVSRFFARVGHSHAGYAGRIVGEQVGVIAEQAVISAVVAKTLKKATGYIAEVPGNAVYYTLSIPANIAIAIQKMMALPPERKFHERIEFINMLLSLPDELVLPATKKKLSQIELYMPDMTLQEENLNTKPMKPRAMSI
jgi:hypothetical protein